MPELPEVETVVRGLRACLPGLRIEGASVTHRKILREPASRFAAALLGATVRDVQRYGKHILVRLTPAAGKKGVSREQPAELWWVVHLGMTGQLTCGPAGRAEAAHTHAYIELSNGQVLRYTDVRRFGRMELFRAAVRNGLPAMPARLVRLGPDPLEITLNEFVGRLRSRRARIKALLLDQHFLRGIGNIYADESLFRCRLHPAAIASRLSRQRATALWHAIREVLNEAIEHGGSSVSDYVDVDGRAGEFQDRHRVYGRGGEPCVVCAARLKRAVVAGRGTTWCPRCQRK